MTGACRWRDAPRVGCACRRGFREHGSAAWPGAAGRGAGAGHAAGVCRRRRAPSLCPLGWQPSIPAHALRAPPACLQRDLKRAVEARTAGAGSAVQVCVHSHPLQRYAVWYGASLLGLSEGFADTGACGWPALRLWEPDGSVCWCEGCLPAAQAHSAPPACERCCTTASVAHSTLVSTCTAIFARWGYA